MNKELRQPYTNTPLLCRRGEAPALIQKAERERDILLEELRAFYSGDIGVSIHAVDHVMGTSIVGDLTVNGEICRTYDPVDLCFIDLNAMIMKGLITAGIGPAT